MQLGGESGFSLRGIERAQQTLLSSYERLASGKRIATAADDAAGLAISERLKALESAMNQGVRNLNDGISVTQVADGGLESISNDLQRLRELSVQAQNGTLNDADRAVIQEEYDQVTAQITQVAQSTSFNGQKLLDGNLSGLNGLEFAGGFDGSDALRFTVDDQSAEALGVADLDVSDPSALTQIDWALERVTTARGGVGSVANRLAVQVRSELRAEETLAAARSRIEDVDLAQEVARSTASDIQLQAALGLRAHSTVHESALLALIG